MSLGRIRSGLAKARAKRRRAQAARPFSAQAKKRILLVTLPERIPQSQVYPFHHYEAELGTRFGAEIREVDLAAFLSGAQEVRGATTVCFQSEYGINAGFVKAFLARLRATSPGARLVYLDWFAPTDLRLAELLDPHVDLYVKKHVLRDRAQYGRETYGDTTLMDYYGHRFGLDHVPQRFAIPSGFLDKLLVGPSFVTADFLLPGLAAARVPPGARPIDLHARIAVTGTPWYEAMRGESLAAVEALDEPRVVTGTGIRHDAFLAELRQSKLCFSPFGYGEVCWRDFEAIKCGAVLLKQDMAQVEVRPDIFIPGETYVPLRWDLSDFADVVQGLLDDPTRRAAIAQNALGVLKDYATSHDFVDQIAPVIG